MSNISKQKRMILLYLLIIYCLTSVASGVGPNEVVTWENTGFSGESRLWYFDPGMRQKLDSNTKWEPIKSIEIGSNLKVAVYRGSSFTGPSRVFEDSVNYVGDYWNGAIMSVIIFPKDQAYPLGVTLSQEAPYTITGYEPKSEFFPLPEDLNETEALYRAFARDIDENANYAIIQGDNVEAELFPEHNFEPADSSLVVSGQLYGPKTKACSSSYDTQGEYNGRKYYRLGGCSIQKVASMKIRWIGPKERSPTQGTSAGGFISEPSGDQTTTPTGEMPRIVSVSWQPKNKAIQVLFDKFPVVLWNQKWEMDIDNNKMPVTAPEGSPNVRPNAALEKNPTGVLIGTLPWLSPLSTVNFPCCGTIKFCIPEKGCTNEVEFNLSGDGCKTASPKNCGSGTKSSPPESTNHETPPYVTDLLSDKASPQKIGTPIRFEAKAIDTDGDTLLYQFCVEKLEPSPGVCQIKRPWSSDKFWTWTPTELDVGRSSVFFYVRDGAHAGPDSFDANMGKDFNILPADQTPTTGSSMKLEENIDRPGMNYKAYYLPSADLQACINDCANDPNCKAFTYVKPGARGTNSDPECWLKDNAPNPVSSECCVSGIK